MLLFSFMGSRNILIAILVVTVILIFWIGQNKAQRLILLGIVVGGGEIYEEILRRTLHNFSPIKQSLADPLYSFPNEQSLMTFVVFGISIFILVWTIDKIPVRTFLPIVTLLLLVLIAISRMYLDVQLPSDIVAGYVFGSVWLGFNVFIFEVLRLLKKLASDDDNLEKES